MEAQVPAEGILKMSDHGDSKFYHIACSCGNDDDAVTMEVEADECGVTVHFWNKVKTDYWNERWKARYLVCRKAPSFRAGMDRQFSTKYIFFIPPMV